MIRDNKEKVDFIFISLIFMSIFLQNFNINLGFSLKPFMIVLIFIIGYYFFTKKEISLKFYKYEYFFLIFIIYATIRGIFSQYRVDSIRISIGLLIVIILYIISSTIVSDINTRKLYDSIFITGNAFLVLSFVLFILDVPSGGTLDRGIYRLQGTICDPNIFVFFVTPILGLVLYKILKGENKYWITFILAQINVILSYSRGGFIGVLVLFFFVIITFKLFNTKAIITIVLVSIIGFFAVNGIHYNLRGEEQINIKSAIEKRVNDSTGSGRIEIWTHGMEVFKEHIVFGIGLNNFRKYNINLFKDDHYMHNTLLEIIVEQGIIGFIPFCIFIVLLLFQKTNNESAILFKIIAFSLMVQSLFLSNIINEVFYLSIAIYKGLLLKDDKIKKNL